MSAVATDASAQRRGAAAQAPTAKHEIGVDMGLAYADVDGFDSGLRIGAPIDVRLGFVPRGKMMFEIRLALLFDSGTSGEGTYLITPGVNIVYPMGRSSTHRRGMYLTGGAGLILADGGTETGTGFSFNGAIGTRKPIGGNAALRFEGGIRYDSEAGNVIPATLNVGGLIGLSFCH
ncbi:MAG: hypothetical protein ACRD08_02230 [Acidimicrobiales bacterium]